MPDPTTIARMMNSEPFGDSLTASFFGTAAQLWGDQSIVSAQNSLIQQPESITDNSNQNQRQKLYATIGVKQKAVRLCGGVPCPDGTQTPAVNLQVNKQGDVYAADNSIDIAAPNIPGFAFPNYDQAGSVGGKPINQFIDVAGDRYEKDDATPVSFWDNITGTNDCTELCSQFPADSPARKSCLADCNKTNAKNDMFSTMNITKIVLLVVGVILLGVGLKSITN